MGNESDGVGGGGVSRRTFLRGAVGTGLVAAVSTAPIATAQPSAAALTRLDASLAGSVIGPADAARFPGAKSIFNTRYDSTRPAAVVVPQTTEDVARALTFARRNHLTVSARSGGHSYIGASAADAALILDLRGLSTPISYDEETATVTVSPATTLFDLQTTLHRSGRSLPAGTCPTVGIGGLTLGGGIGTESREFGLTCDHLTQATVVVADGRVLSVSDGEHDNLLWALRGGGGGAVGVVTSMTFSTHPATSKDLVLLGFPSDTTVEVVAGWAAWLPSVHRDTWVGVNVESDQTGGVRCGVLFACPPGSGDQIAAQFATAVGVTPNFAASATLTPDEILLRLAGGTPTATPHGFTAGSDVLRSITPESAEAIVAVIMSRSAAGAVGSVIIDPIDGAVTAVSPDASAFPWRRHTAILQWFVDVGPGDSYAAATSWIRDAHDAVRATSSGAYVNYAEPGTAPRRYFGRNHARLRATRATYDPTGVVIPSTTVGTTASNPGPSLFGSS